MSRRTAATSSWRLPRTICFTLPASGGIRAAIFPGEERARPDEAVGDRFMSESIGAAPMPLIAMKFRIVRGRAQCISILLGATAGRFETYSRPGDETTQDRLCQITRAHARAGCGRRRSQWSGVTRKVNREQPSRRAQDIAPGETDAQCCLMPRLSCDGERGGQRPPRSGACLVTTPKRPMSCLRDALSSSDYSVRALGGTTGQRLYRDRAYPRESLGLSRPKSSSASPDRDQKYRDHILR